jgi:catechol 2,3-dioxygenase-like lactoylglutathione lyase family enzyme
MNLGTFSVSLAVKDIKASRAFYEALGFEAFDGDEAQNWLMLRNGETKLGLFQGMFDKNTLTFNLPNVRAAQSTLKAHGIGFVLEADEATTGPAHAMVIDPDGNPILMDQVG